MGFNDGRLSGFPSRRMRRGLPSLYVGHLPPPVSRGNTSKPRPPPTQVGIGSVGMARRAAAVPPAAAAPPVAVAMAAGDVAARRTAFGVFPKTLPISLPAAGR